jgi:hypothetical protein
LPRANGTTLQLLRDLRHLRRIEDRRRNRTHVPTPQLQHPPQQLAANPGATGDDHADLAFLAPPTQVAPAKSPVTPARPPPAPSPSARKDTTVKITLTPRTDTVFTPGELREQLNQWIQPAVRGTVTARCTLAGKIKEIVLDVDPDPGEHGREP